MSLKYPLPMKKSWFRDKLKIRSVKTMDAYAKPLTWDEYVVPANVWVQDIEVKDAKIRGMKKTISARVADISKVKVGITVLYLEEEYTVISVDSKTNYRGEVSIYNIYAIKKTEN